MFVGHVAVAFALWFLFPGVDPLVALVGVSLPDVLFGVLLLAGVEDVDPSPSSPLWSDVAFTGYPYSHSLVLGGLLALVGGAGVAAAVGTTAGAVFVAAWLSHWALDVVVHRRDVPVLGFGHDRTVGLGLWTRPVLAFVGEYALYAVAALAFLDPSRWALALGVGAAFHLVTANATFGFTDGNPISTPPRFAAQVLSGYAGLVAVLALALGL